MAVSTTTQAEKAPPVPVASWIGPVAAAWLVPGAGHFLLKKTGRGMLLFMRGTMFKPEAGPDYLTSLINYGGFVSNLASGAMYLLSTMFGYNQPDLPGPVHDYGTKFLVTAGLLNVLAMVDAYEIAIGKKD